MAWKMIFRRTKVIFNRKLKFLILLPIVVGCMFLYPHPIDVFSRENDFDDGRQIRSVNIEGQREINLLAGGPPPGNAYQNLSKQQDAEMNQKIEVVNRPVKNLIETVTLSNSWNASQELLERLAARKEHLKKVCHEIGLDIPTAEYKLNSWEYMINEKYNLIWCNVFKAASSTWIWNFNLLAGYSEDELLSSKKTPVELVRKRYSRPSIEDLVSAQNKNPKPLSFIIVRHPLLRLVSAYRNKIENGNNVFLNLSSKIIAKYPKFGPPVPIVPKNSKLFGKLLGMKVPSFSQFVQYVLDEEAASHKLNEHWVPQSRFCTPCLFDFTVLAKSETLQEDGNYIIFTSGIDKVINPKVINRSTSGSTEEVARELLCQLTTEQFNGLLGLYKHDLELFQYETESYRNCTTS